MNLQTLITIIIHVVHFAGPETENTDIHYDNILQDVFFKGPANTRSIMVPYHNQAMDEDDVKFLPMMHAVRDLPGANARIQSLQQEHEHLLWALLDKECQVMELEQDMLLQRKNKSLYDAITARKKLENLSVTKK
jgi:hypothetical protein